VTDLIAGEPTYVDPTSVPVINHLDFLCRVVLTGQATARSLSVIEQRARRECMTPATCVLLRTSNRLSLVLWRRQGLTGPGDPS
jgi:hypothetical protein